MGLLDAPASVIGVVLDPIGSLIKNPFNTTIGKSQGPDFPKGFQITEIIDGRAGETLSLLGDMLPLESLDTGGSQKIVKQYYPGNPEPTTHVLGSREDDVPIRGRLQAKRYKDLGMKGGPEAVKEALDLIRIRGNLLKLQLGNWKRYGFLEEAKFKVRRLTDIDYELKFSIVGFRIPTNNKFNRKDRSLPHGTNAALLKSIETFQAEYSALPSSMPLSIGALLNNAISDVAKAVKAVTTFVDSVVSTAEDITNSANRAIGLIKYARASVSRYKRRVGAIRLTIGSLSSETKAAAKFKAAYSNAQFISRSQNSANSLAAYLAKMQKQFEAIAKTTPLARHLVRDGDTLQKIAIKWYNNAENWKSIFDHNRLTSTTLTPGKILEIPRI